MINVRVDPIRIQAGDKDSVTLISCVDAQAGLSLRLVHMQLVGNVVFKQSVKSTLRKFHQIEWYPKFPPPFTLLANAGCSRRQTDDLFSYFPQKTGLDISCKLSSYLKICFLGKIRKIFQYVIC